MASINMYHDLPSIDYAVEDTSWHHAPNERIQYAATSHHPLDYQTMNCFGMDNTLQSPHDNIGMEVLQFPPLELDHGSLFDDRPWALPRRALHGPQGSYEDFPRRAFRPVHVSPSVACLDERMASEPDSCSDGSTWSPGPSEHNMEADATSARSPTMYDSFHYRCQVQGLQYEYYGQSPAISEVSVENSLRGGSGNVLHDVQQYPDAYPEEHFSKLPCADIKLQYPNHEIQPGTPGTLADDNYMDRYPHLATPTPSDTITLARNGSEQPNIKDEAMSDAATDGGSDYSPVSRHGVNGGRTARKGRVSKSSPKRNGKVQPKAKPRATANYAVKRHLKRTSSDTITLSSPNKPLSGQCPDCGESTSSKAALTKHISAVHTRPFTCTFKLYGCPATFGSKNEWKRHVSTQHLRLGIWRCNNEGCHPKESQPGENGMLEPIYNDFNRKDLFTQHLRRMHPPHTACSQNEHLRLMNAPHTPCSQNDHDIFNSSLEQVAQQCRINLRDPPPYSVCGYCSADSASVFEGQGSWESRMEHVGRHLESLHGETKQWKEDVELRDWMIKEGLIEGLVGGQFRLVGLQVEDGKSKRAKK